MYAGATTGIFIGIALSTISLWSEIVTQGATDYAFYVRQAERWFAGGGFYELHQLAGIYSPTGGVDNLYPPPALLLFLPFVWLPALLWWAIPLAIVGVTVCSFRPAPSTWPAMAFLAWLPRSESIVIWGNTTMWLVAFVALGLRFGWPSVLVLIKPYFAPFALIGFGRRPWIIAAVVFGAVNVLLLPVWLDYLAAWRNATNWPGLGYSPADFLVISIPLVAWLARRRDPDAGRVRVPVQLPAG